MVADTLPAPERRNSPDLQRRIEHAHQLPIESRHVERCALGRAWYLLQGALSDLAVSP